MVKTRLYAVTGRPVLHSKSPLMFNSVFQGQDTWYFRMGCHNAGEAMDLFKKIGLQGMNVTAPFKKTIMQHLDSCCADAEKIGSVNTVVRQNDLIKGYNTDHIGVVASLASLKIDMKGRKILVIGAGGAGKAAVFGLVKVGLEVTLVNRTGEKARKVSEKLGCGYAPFSMLKSLIKSSDVIISTLPAETVDLEPDWLDCDKVIFDAVYRDSRLESLAAKVGCRFISGEEWLFNQAVPAYSIFTGTGPDRVRMKEKVWSENPVYKKRTSIGLIGFMGAGKTAVGKRLAERLGYTFVDMDHVIVQKAGLGIPEIFSKYGESYFRKLEKETLIEHLYRRRIIIAFGGGVVSDIENRELIRENMIPVWLYASVPVCLSRIKSGTRPLLECDDPVKKAEELFDKRTSCYADACELVVDGEMQLEQVVDIMYEEIDNTFKG